MSNDYSFGVAFILEGDTEKIFYTAYLEHCCKKHPGTCLEKVSSQTSGETFYVLTRRDKSKVLIKLSVVNTISQITNSGNWFVNRCYHAHKPLKWYVFLCYDTDSYLENISKFHEGDWKELRKALGKGRPLRIIDLAASADIEDIMLLDINGVFTFLDISPVPLPSGRKGKRKMQQLFRLKDPKYAYHSGIRATDLINALDFDVITSLAPIPLCDLEHICFS